MVIRDFIAELLESDLSRLSPEDVLRTVQVQTLNGNMGRAYDFLEDGKKTNEEIASRLGLTAQYSSNIMLALVRAGVVRRDRNGDEIYVYERIPLGQR